MPQQPTFGKRTSSPKCRITAPQRAAVSGAAVFSVQWRRMSSGAPPVRSPTGIRPAATSSARKRSRDRTDPYTLLEEYFAYFLYSSS